MPWAISRYLTNVTCNEADIVQELLKQEMLSTINWYKDHLVKLRRQFIELDASGSVSLLIREEMYLEMITTNLKNLFRKYIGDTCTPTPLTITENIRSDDYKKNGRNVDLPGIC